MPAQEHQTFGFDGVVVVPEADAVAGRADVLNSLILRCHRAPPKVVSGADNQIRSKKNAHCPFRVRIEVRKSDPTMAVITEHRGHMGHTPGEGEDWQWTGMPGELLAPATELLRAGLTPTQAQVELQKRAAAGEYGPAAAAKAQFVSGSHIRNLKKKLLSESRVDANDVKAVKKLVEAAGDDILYYCEQEVEDGEVRANLRLAICPRFGREQLARSGRRLIFMDAVYGTTKYGYPMLTLVVRDEFGHACPVAMCIASAETADIWVEFLTAVLQSAGLDPTQCAFMIDKSKTEMAAIKKIGAKFLLCHFHMLQEAERFLKSAASGISGRNNKAQRVAVLLRLAQLQKGKDAFDANSRAFCEYLSSKNMDKVLQWYKSNWEPDWQHWAGMHSLAWCMVLRFVAFH